jgi:hypothetical protein
MRKKWHIQRWWQAEQQQKQGSEFLKKVGVFWKEIRKKLIFEFFFKNTKIYFKNQFQKRNECYRRVHHPSLNARQRHCNQAHLSIKCHCRLHPGMFLNYNQKSYNSKLF